MDPEFRTCQAPHTAISKSPYPKDKVPISEFRKNKNDENSKLLKRCFHCREYGKLVTKRNNDKRKAKADANNALTLNSEYLQCQSNVHGKSKSIHLVTRVPSHLFRRIPNDPKSDLYKTCVDCRIYSSNYKNDWIEQKICSANEKGLIYCTGCNKEQNIEDMAYNLDGFMSKTCLGCKIRDTDRVAENYKRFQLARREHLLETIEKYQCSCFKCKCLYFKPSQNSLIVVKIETYSKNGQDRYFINNNMEYKIRDVFNFIKDFLEVSIIEFDHLSESEQRFRGLLLPNEDYVEKINAVSSMQNEVAMRLEALKCQHLCAKCHLEETRRRSDEDRIINRDGVRCVTHPETVEKIQYVNGIKATGCVSCRYINLDLLCFFDMDHLDPETKTDNVSQMVSNSKYTIEKIIEECMKCRVLCKFCHAIHTRNQRIKSE